MKKLIEFLRNLFTCKQPEPVLLEVPEEHHIVIDEPTLDPTCEERVIPFCQEEPGAEKEITVEQEPVQTVVVKAKRRGRPRKKKQNNQN